MPPTNCQRTSGCSSVSLSIGRSMRVTRPAASSAARCVWKSSAGPLILPDTPRWPGWSSMALLLVLLPRLDDRLGVAEAIDAARNAAIDRDLDQHRADFIRRHAVVERAADVGLELLHPAKRGNHAEVEDRALARWQRVVAPGLAPAILRDDTLEVAIEVVGVRHRLIDVFIAGDLAAHLHADVVGFLVHENP